MGEKIGDQKIDRLVLLDFAAVTTHVFFLHDRPGFPRALFIIHRIFTLYPLRGLLSMFLSVSADWACNCRTKAL